MIVVAIGALIRKIDSVSRVPRVARAQIESAPRVEPVLEPEPPVEPDAPPESDEASAEPDAPVDEEDPVNENRAGRLPTLAEVEHAIAEPERPPTLVGRDKSGGAHYMIFSDGTIEAETEQGAFRFASMGDFKAFIADRKKANSPAKAPLDVTERSSPRRKESISSAAQSWGGGVGRGR